MLRVEEDAYAMDAVADDARRLRAATAAANVRARVRGHCGAIKGPFCGWSCPTSIGLHANG
jgi:hypothetical protein